MTYRQFTKCVSVANHIGGQYAQILIAAAVAAIPLLAGAAVGPALLIIALTAIIAYCRWWLYDRLICLDGGADVCAAGWVLTVEPPEEKSGLDAFDTDYSFNLVLPPHLVGATQGDVENDGVLGNLVKEQTNISSAGLDFSGNLVQQWANDPPTACLHCEFEGGGVYDLMIACLAALAVAVAAAIICAIPIIGWVVCLILSLISAAIAVVGIAVALNDKGNPDDVGTNLGELHVNDPTGRGADLLVVKGSWVYDSAHSGWNEIHPIKYCQRIGTWEGNWAQVGDPKAWVDQWCNAIGTASDPLTVANQQEPQNQWTIHPVIDGCDSGDGSQNGQPPIIK
jgi:hypothetical protein